MEPLIGLGDFGQLDGDAGAAEVYVGDKRVKSAAVPTNAEPDHAPTGVIGKADAEDGELGFIERIARAPEKGERASLRIDVSGRPVGKQLIVAALKVGAADTVRKNLDVALVVRDGIAARGVVGVEAVVAGEIEEQAGLGGVGIGREDGGGDGRSGFQGDLRMCDGDES